MMKRSTARRATAQALLQGLILLSGLTVQAARADGDRDFLQAVTCTLPDDDEHLEISRNGFKTRGRENNMGQVSVAGRVQSGDVCVERVTAMGGPMGGLVVTGSVCDGRTKPILDFVAGNVEGLRPVPADDMPPGAIAAFRSMQFGFTLFHGQPVPDGLDPSSKTISYSCVMQPTPRL